MQTEALDFDPNIYFGVVADNLLKNLGERALYYADEALKKMKLLDDDEGFDMWLGIHRHLTMKADLSFYEESVTIH